nr:unnamed protein product [Callosobruchus chinensis]
MSPRKKSKSKNAVESKDLEKIVESLAQSMVQMQVSISNLAVTLQNQNESRINQNVVRSKGDAIVGKQYISLWKDLGGGNVCFYPGGSLHPMQFLNKIEKLFYGAGVSEDAKVGLAISCLRQSAADWAMNKEKYDFLREFRERYWNSEHERTLYYDIKYGGNRGDYLLKFAGLASHLCNSIDESDLVHMLVDHFPSEIERGVVLNGIKRLDDFEKYLRMIDGTYKGDRRQGNSRGVFRPQQVRNSGNQNNMPREGEQNRRITEKYGRYYLSQKTRVEEHFKSPVFRGVVGGELIEVLMDSGNQISAVSQDFAVAVEEKKYRVKEQVLLSVTIQSGQGKNKQFTFNNICIKYIYLFCLAATGLLQRKQT